MSTLQLNCGGVKVTMAEGRLVFTNIASHQVRVIYSDSESEWVEFHLDPGQYTAFAPAKGEIVVTVFGVGSTSDIPSSVVAEATRMFRKIFGRPPMFPWEVTVERLYDRHTVEFEIA